MSKKKMEIRELILEEIKVGKRKEKNNKIYRRLLFLEMKHGGMQNGDIALYSNIPIFSYP